MFIFYDIIFVLFAVVYIPYMIIRGKWHKGFQRRFGFFDGAIMNELHDGGVNIWIHAVSVGEIMAVTGLIEQIKLKYPSYKLVCSTVTKTGYQIAQERLRKNCIVIYAPLDFSWIVRKFIATIKPKIYISMETEIWPNLYTALHKNGIPIVQVNGRISDNAFKGYKRVSLLTKRVLHCVRLFCMQSSLDAERVVQLGAQPDKIRVVGNLKFDSVPQLAEIRKEDVGFKQEEDLWIAGSTHPGEEAILIDAYAQLHDEYKNLRLVIVPRHVERTGELIRLIEKKGYKAVRFSKIHNTKKSAKDIIIVDSIGHLQLLYSLAKVVFIGKTLAVGGGQNMIESAYFGKPTIVGPMTQNFKDVVKILRNAGGLIQVNTAAELLENMKELLRNPDREIQVGKAAKQSVLKYQGATAKTLEAVGEVLAL